MYIHSHFSRSNSKVHWYEKKIYKQSLYENNNIFHDKLMCKYVYVTNQIFSLPKKKWKIFRSGMEKKKPLIYGSSWVQCADNLVFYLNILFLLEGGKRWLLDINYSSNAFPLLEAIFNPAGKCLGYRSYFITYLRLFQ